MTLTSIKNILEKKNYHTFLVDASGVIYTHHQLCHDANTTFSFLQQQGPTFLVTNNSYYYPPYIVDQLKAFDITINTSHIISSGFGLSQDPEILSLIKDKHIFFVGKHHSLQYLLDGGAIKSSSLDDAEGVVLAAATKEEAHELVPAIINWAKKHPLRPIICCNPDRHIVSSSGLYPVIGTYASDIEQAIQRPILWHGKPFKNFSTIVHSTLTSHDIPVDEGVLFFDDNLENVMALKQHCGISGCWVHGTGIQGNESLDLMQDQFGKPDAIIDGFSLNPET